MLVESAANVWDAGIHNVDITIPYEEYKKIVVEDDRTGMTDREFRNRRMTSNRDRQKRQEKEVDFPTDVKNSKRVAYGRNGIGHHDMLCFSDSYIVETRKDRKRNTYDIAVARGGALFKIIKHITNDRLRHGAKISAFVSRRLLDATVMTDILSA